MAIATGAASGLVVIDIDQRHGGYASWAEFVESSGLTGVETSTVLTGGGGRHLFFRHPRNGETVPNRGGWLPGVDVRGDGGYVVAAPSSHVSGGVYRWLDSEPPSVMPDALLEAIRRGGRSTDPGAAVDLAGVLGGLPAGERDEGLFRYACSLRRKLGNRAEVEALVMAAASNCQPPFPREEALAKVDQAFRQDHPDVEPWMVAAAESLLAVDPREAEVERQAERMRVRAEASRRVRVEEAAREYAPLGPDKAGTLSDLLALPPMTEPYRIDGLLGMTHNAVLGAQYKTGKTTLGVNLLRSCADALPFLGRDVRPLSGTVAWLNGEMDRDDFTRYVRPVGIVNSDRVVVQNLRGERLPVMNDYVAEELVKWLTLYGVEFLIVDSWRRLVTWSGLDENRNSEIDALTDRIDRIKAEAGVSTFLAIAHTGRGEQEQGREHVRGATALDDWVDARWMMTRTPDLDRFFYAEGRGVEFKETALVFDSDTKRLDLGEGNRKTSVSGRGVDLVLAYVCEHDGDYNTCKTVDVTTFLGRNGITSSPSQQAAIKAALGQGLVERRKHGQAYVFSRGSGLTLDEMQRIAAGLQGAADPGWS